MKYDLEERTLKFNESISDINRSILSQVIRSATSVGVNYFEANGASSKKDFKNKIHICKKEIKETNYWLRLIEKTNPEKIEEIKPLRKEAQEPMFIFSKIIGTMSKIT